MTRLAFVDTETTGLDPERHQVWELAIILRDGDEDQEYAWQLPVDLSCADPTGLRIGRFYERRNVLPGSAPVAQRHMVLWPSREEWTGAGLPLSHTAETVARLLDGAHMVGAVPSFDAAFLTRWLRAHGQAPTWHYHLVDVEALAAGRMQTSPPWNSTDLSLSVGVEPEDFDRHTALGDARWARAIYDAVIVGAA